jgi:hypothetical protein
MLSNYNQQEIKLMHTELTARTQQHIATLFAPELQQQVSLLLIEQCGNNLPMLKSLDAKRLERYRFAALKLSQGSIDKLKEAIALARRDWRDLLVAAEFADDIHAHESWMP